MEKKRAEKINNLITTSLNNSIFPGAAIAFSKWENSGYDRFMKYYGFAQHEPSKKKLTKDHFFDLASLTKPLATVPVLMALFEDNILKPKTRLEEIFPFCPVDKRKITIKQLMSHSAGFVPHREYFNELIQIPEKKRKEVLLKKILAEKLSSFTEDYHCYSDLGFMLLGLIIEKITGKDMDELTRVLIYKPLGLQNDLFFPGLSEKKGRTYVSTEKCLWGEIMLSGAVHDDNCRAIGGQSGHAGLFGTLQGVVRLCEHLLDQWQDRSQHPAYSNKLLKSILTRVGESTWTMGFNMVSEEGSSSGNYFSKKSVGHLGFTGTSFWIDPEKDCTAVLLTNRVHYGRENWKIKKFRPVFHDLLMEGV